MLMLLLWFAFTWFNGCLVLFWLLVYCWLLSVLFGFAFLGLLGNTLRDCLFAGRYLVVEFLVWFTCVLGDLLGLRLFCEFDLGFCGWGCYYFDLICDCVVGLFAACIFILVDLLFWCLLVVWFLLSACFLFCDFFVILIWCFYCYLLWCLFTFAGSVWILIMFAFARLLDLCFFKCYFDWLDWWFWLVVLVAFLTLLMYFNYYFVSLHALGFGMCIMFD